MTSKPFLFRSWMVVLNEPGMQVEFVPDLCATFLKPGGVRRSGLATCRADTAPTV
jgi:hypothetical protein